MILHSTWYGTFVLAPTAEGFKVLEARPAPADPSDLASELMMVSRGEALPREVELASKHPIDAITDRRLLRVVSNASVVDGRELPVPGPEGLGLNMQTLAEASRLMASIKMSDGPKDRNVLSMVGAINDIDSSLNLVKERIAEWMAKYWAGSENLVENRSFLEAMRDDPDLSTVHERLSSLDPAVVQGLEPPGEVAADLGGISPLCTLVLSLSEARDRMETYIGTEMQLVAPSLAEVVGPLIGARLIHSAGGLLRLSRLPASTVQVLGAEKMFFKFLKEGGKPPKHGVLFQHPWVHSLPAQKRGRMARSLASAASIAARLDANGGSGVTGIKARLERRAAEIKTTDKKKALHGGRQPPFREGWWADRSDRDRRPDPGRSNKRRWK